MESIDAIDVEPLSVECYYPDVKFSVLSKNKVHQSIQSSSNATSQLDPLPMWLFNLCTASKVTHLVNYLLTKAYVPDQWKTALVTPLQDKNGNDFHFKNYRPVSRQFAIS